jgi:hypothetical protein
MAKWFVAVRELRVPEPMAAPAQVEHSFLNEHSAKEFGRRLHKDGKYIIVDARCPTKILESSTNQARWRGGLAGD